MLARINDLEKAMHKYKVERFGMMLNQKTEYVKKMNATFCKALDLLIKVQEKRQLEEETSKVKNIYLCRLLTSGYTDGYRVMLGISDANLYLDEKQSQVYWYPAAIYESLEKDMESVAKILRQKFIRLQESELFSMKQKLLDDNWLVLEECYLELIRENYSLIKESPLRQEDNVFIQSGNYMDKPYIIDIQKGENQ